VLAKALRLTELENRALTGRTITWVGLAGRKKLRWPLANRNPLAGLHQSQAVRCLARKRPKQQSSRLATSHADVLDKPLHGSATATRRTKLTVETSRRKRLEKIALERLTANADDPWDYLRAQGADILGPWCSWSTYEDEIFDGRIEGLDLSWSEERAREIEDGAALTNNELAQWRHAMCHWRVRYSDHGLMVWIVPVRTDGGAVEGYAVWLDIMDNPAPSVDDIQLFGIFDNADEAKGELTANGALLEGSR
jgi:hypothetical protein